MISDIIQKLTSLKTENEILVCEQEEYFNGTPQCKEVCDVVRDKNKLILLTR